ncbi:MAG TPA: hypothetical protein VHC68_00720 [Candidatus Paceibacterota bacterium]|nr:hypothetical protein [Candidatus Paceibacterota bacterium]
MTTDHQSGSLAKRVLDRIEGERVRPRPRWEFLARDWFFWLLGGVSVALGAVAIAAALFEVANADWRFWAATHGDFMNFFLSAAPFLWILALALFILVGYVNIRRTRRGYRYPFWLIALGAVLTSAVLGGALFAAGLGEPIEEAVGDHPPFYRPIEAAERAWWLSPEHGLLGGTVVGVSSTSDAFTLRSFDGSLWQVGADALSTTSAAVVERGGEVRIVGVPSKATSTFEGCYVFAWQVEGARRAPPPAAPFALRLKAGAPSGTTAVAVAAPAGAPGVPRVETFSVTARSNPCTGVSPYGSPRAISGD